MANFNVYVEQYIHTIFILKCIENVFSFQAWPGSAIKYD